VLTSTSTDYSGMALPEANGGKYSASKKSHTDL